MRKEQERARERPTTPPTPESRRLAAAAVPFAPVRPLALLFVFLAVSAVGCAGRRPPAPDVDLNAMLQERGVANRTINEAAQLVEADEPREAFDLLKLWFAVPQTYQHPDRPDALFVAADAVLAYGRTKKAFYYLDELLDTYPGSDLYRTAAARQYEIADAVLRQERRFDLSGGPSDFDALEMLFRVQQRAPGSELAERALVRTGDYYFDRGDYDFAEDAYTVFLSGFPRSQRAPVVRLRQAWSNLLQYQGPKYDPTPLLDARAQFEDLQADGIGGEAVGDAIAYVDEQLGEKSILQSEYFGRVHRPRATRHLLAEEAARRPDTEAGQRAQRRLAALDPLPPEPTLTPEDVDGSQPVDPGDPAGVQP